MAREAERRSVKRRKPSGFGAAALLAAAAGALALGAGGMWLVAGGGSRPAAAAAGVEAAQVFAAAARHFPEAYPEFSKIVFERQATGAVWPVETHLFVPASRFSADLADRSLSGAADIARLERTFATASPLNAQEMRKRLEGLSNDLAQPGALRCQDYSIGPERNVPWPNWPDHRVREVILAFNANC